MLVDALVMAGPNLFAPSRPLVDVLAAARSQGIDAVVHSAGVVKARSEADFFLCNTQGTANLLDAAKEHAPSLKRFVHVSSLGDDYFYLEAETHTLIGRRSGKRYRLGDRIQVEVVRVDIDRRELDLIVPGAPSDRRKGAERVLGGCPAAAASTMGR